MTHTTGELRDVLCLHLESSNCEFYCLPNWTIDKQRLSAECSNLYTLTLTLCPLASTQFHLFNVKKPVQSVVLKTYKNVKCVREMFLVRYVSNARMPGMLSMGICRTPSLKQERPG